MGKPGDRVSFDAFTPTGDGARINDLFARQHVPAHVARYTGLPPYMTTQAERDRLRKRGDVP